jgi:hypothetical protein
VNPKWETKGGYLGSGGLGQNGSLSVQKGNRAILCGQGWVIYYLIPRENCKIKLLVREKALSNITKIGIWRAAGVHTAVKSHMTRKLFICPEELGFLSPNRTVRIA